MSISQHILVATDFSEAAEAALNPAASLARDLNAAVTLCHVLDPAPLAAILAPTRSDEELDEVEAAAHRVLKQNLDTNFESISKRHGAVISHSDPAQGIVDYAKTQNIDLIVLATRGRSGITRILIGSVAEKVVPLASCPVLTIPVAPSNVTS